MTSAGMLSNSMLAIENAPTSQPARVHDTHGAGAFLPFSSIICNWPSPDLPVQLRALGATRPELAVVMVGANDVIERTPPQVAAAFLEDTVRELRARGTEVVVGTCPDLGTIRPLAQPLRAYARRLSRQMAKAQTVAVVSAGGRSVSLGDLLGPMFTSRLELFSADGFHPSAEGYGEATRAVLPSCLDALGLRTRSRSASAFTTRRVKPVAKAAAQAVTHPGTEVAGAERFGRTENRRGPLAQLRRRLPRRRRTAVMDAQQAEQATPVQAAPPRLIGDSNA
jgi:hypothetical protein